MIADRVAIVRNVMVTGSTMQDVDFSTAVSTASFPVVAPNWYPRSETRTVLHTAGGTAAPIAQVSYSASSPPFATVVAAASLTTAGDVYEQIAAGDIGADEFAIVSNATVTPAPRTFDSPAPLRATASVANSVPLILATTWAAFPDAIGYVAIAAQGAPCPWTTRGECTTTWTALLSPAYVGDEPMYETPRLSTLPGWSNYLAFKSTRNIRGSLTVLASTDSADFPPPAVPLMLGTDNGCATTPPTAGTQRTCVTSRFSITP